jgi:thiosulfate/3-mercaptopyruvate sulfurtransferase
VSNGFGPLVGTDWLTEHLDHKPLRVIDCRWYLTDPERGRAEYEAGHIPGASYMSVDTDLSLTHGPGRHPLPRSEETAHRLGARGIGDRNFVVAYDDAGGAIAARLWWMLKSIGHQRVAVLDGGIQAWTADGGALDKVVPTWPPAGLSVLGASQTIERAALTGRLGGVKLLDARAAERYNGDTEPVDAAAGHIPTAINVPYTENLGADGRFLPAEALRERYTAAGITDAADAVVYCGSGVTACHDILAMEVAGLGTATLYPGSWSDWSASGGPVATGLEPGAASSS